MNKRLLLAAMTALFSLPEYPILRKPRPESKPKLKDTEAEAKAEAKRLRKQQRRLKK